MSSANLAVLRYVPEVTFGVTPANPAMKQLRYLSESVNFNIENVVSEEVTPTRVETDLIQTSADAAGDINFEFSFGSFDDWLEAVMCNSYTSVSGNIQNLINGILLKSFTLQKHFQDMQVPQFHNFRGTVINTANLQFELGAIVKGTFGVMALGCVQTSTQYTGATFPAVNTNPPMNSVTNFQNFNVDGVPYNGCINSMSLNIANNIRPRDCLGTLGHVEFALGTIQVTGNMNMYFRDGTIFDKFVNGIEFPFNYAAVDKNNNRYTFYVPRAKFESAEVVAGGKDTDVMFNATWRGLYGGTANPHVLRIVKDPVG